jgi:hypothetical protein
LGPNKAHGKLAPGEVSRRERFADSLGNYERRLPGVHDEKPLIQLLLHSPGLGQPVGGKLPGAKVF